MFKMFLNQQGARLFSEDMTKTTFNSPEGVRALQLMIDLIHIDRADALSGVPAQIPGLSDLVSGSLATHWTGTAHLFSASKFKPELLDEIGVTDMPYPADGKKDTFAACLQLLMNAKTKHPEEAWRLMTFLVEPENMNAMNAAVGRLPARYSAMSLPYGQDPKIQRFFSTLEYATPEPTHLDWLEMVDHITLAVQNSIYKETTIEEALDEAVMKIERLLTQ